MIEVSLSNSSSNDNDIAFILDTLRRSKDKRTKTLWPEQKQQKSYSAMFCYTYGHVKAQKKLSKPTKNTHS